MLVLGSVTACGLQTTEDRRAAPDDSRPLVLTTFTVLADMARNVAGDRLRVHSITRQGAEIHGYEPTPSDLAQAASAQLIVENGLGLERWARRFTAVAGAVSTITLSDGLQPVLIEGDVYAGRPNPHAWMSPKLAQHYVERLVQAFTALDPAGATTYRRNGDTYNQQLQQLDQDLRSTLDRIPPSTRLLVTCEGAFSYLARDYGLKEAYLWPVNAESQATPKRMARLIDTVRQSKVPAVFCESTVNDRIQRQVAEEAGVRFGGTFYVDSLSKPNGPAPTLLDLQRHNVRLLQQGLQPQGQSQ
ncbi:MAG: metal ABC transporter substrate-binding protein [Synechococcus sp.]